MPFPGLIPGLVGWRPTILSVLKRQVRLRASSVDGDI